MQALEKVGEKPNKIYSHSYRPNVKTKCILVVNNIDRTTIKIYNIVSEYLETKHPVLKNWIGIWKIKN
jgi:hypothetical protein